MVEMVILLLHFPSHWGVMDVLGGVLLLDSISGEKHKCGVSTCVLGREMVECRLF